MSTFHQGELEVQHRAGVSAMAARVGGSIGATIPLAAQEFLLAQPFVVLGSEDADGEVWASLLRGEPGFAHGLDDQTLQIDVLPAASDPLRAALGEGRAVGMLAIEPATRRRMRLNGTSQIHDDSLFIHAAQVYSNCPKYIQKRELRPGVASSIAASTTRARQLSPQQIRFIEGADTFFIASVAPAGADASHRGGNPGFVRVESETRLIFPDYAGNAMFNTLGNLQVNPRAGLLFVDFEAGATVQLTGTARVDWNSQNTAFPGAERVVEFEIAAVVATRGATHWHWTKPQLSPFNPSSG